ncbi:MAG: HEAT repeat domain-containing protein, partial [Thermoanaerobaculia bacterium]|nr:HEAT repeat domain-containing protein [Thermoanaerobaculia bacterium]
LRAIAIGVGTLTVIVVGLLVLVFVHHLISDRRRAKNRRRFQEAADFLAPYLVVSHSQIDKIVDDARSRFGDRAVSLVLRRARFDLKGNGAQNISRLLEEMGSVKKLIKQARHRKEWKRVNGVRGLGECGGPMARQVMIEAASDTSPAVRRAARDGLLNDGHQESIRAAVSSFLADLPRRAGWRHAFYARLASVAPPALLELIRSDRLKTEEKKLALEALADAGSEDVLPISISLLDSEEQELRATAVRAIGKLGGHGEISLALERLEDDEWFVRAAAARALETILTTHASEITVNEANKIAEALGDKIVDRSWWVRANAARALARTGQVGANVLLSTAEGDDTYARDAALAALAMADLTESARAKVDAIIQRLLSKQKMEVEGSPA